MSARQWANGGLEAFQCGKLEKACGLLSRATEQDPSDFRSRANLARSLHQSGDQQQAIIQMQQAADQSSHDPRMLIELGEMYLEAGQWLPAKRQVELALEMNRRFAPAWVLSGKTSIAKGNYEQGLADFQKALGYDPELQSAQMLIVETYQKMGQPLRALSAVEQVLNRHPFDEQPEDAIIAKSVALLQLEQVASAIDVLTTASQHANASEEIYVRLGQAQLMAGRLSQAQATLGRGRQAFPNSLVFTQLINELQSAEHRVASAQTSLPH